MGDLGDQWGKAGQGGMLWGRGEEGPGRGREEEREEEKGKLLGANPEVGYWAKPQASTPLSHLHHPQHHLNPDHHYDQ